MRSAGLEATLLVPAPGALKERLYPNGKQGGLTIDGPKPGVLGQRVTVTVTVTKPARAFTFVGQLAWARHKTVGAQVASYGVDFLPGEDPAWVRLVAFANDELPAEATRLEARVAVELKVRVLHDGKERREQLADFSHGGAFIRTWNPLKVGEWVDLVVRPPRALLPVRLKGRVAWARLTGFDPGMGVAFFDADGTQTVAVRRLMERLTTKLVQASST